ncbi:nitroreductase/quinone reductase family protein [Streptomyces sp. Ru72]|uniref:nitroreductase/quinone reductase family protein n=1 Tax=Streptomyces sp. Ru72 TaxID=2080747 RepID=UPI000CDDB06B|nr:nitroreductase/quinone reductase family protein [Streptomyces sp. Ru72]POX41622.1 nitroreductase family deazaflavin-dependent oxidoreductase [Streptomyces sp. Ru72]
MPNPFNQQIIDEFRAHHGRVGGPFEGARLLLLTTTGARTGTPHTTPLGYYPDGGERVLVIASAGGASRHPDWFHNLVAHPQVTVETGVFTYEATAIVLDRAARDEAFARAVESNPGWAEYQAKTDRVIPVVALRENPRPGPPRIEAASPGEAIRAVHDLFRRELALIRKEFAASGSGSAPGAQLRINCLTLCKGLGNHHAGEDIVLFPSLEGRHPELAPAFERLRREHERIAALLDDLRRVVSAPDADGTRALTEVERLTGELEAHLTYEEEQLLPLLG